MSLINYVPTAAHTLSRTAAAPLARDSHAHNTQLKFDLKFRCFVMCMHACAHALKSACVLSRAHAHGHFSPLAFGACDDSVPGIFDLIVEESRYNNNDEHHSTMRYAWADYPPEGYYFQQTMGNFMRLMGMTEMPEGGVRL